MSLSETAKDKTETVSQTSKFTATINKDHSKQLSNIIANNYQRSKLTRNKDHRLTLIKHGKNQ